MKIRTLTHIAVAAVIATFLAGCNVDQEHAKFVKEERSNFELHRLGIVYQVAEQQYKVGDMAKCRESVKAALTVTTPFAPLHVLAAKVELEGGSLEVAANQLKEAIKIDAGKAEPYYLLGVVYQRWQNFEAARDYYEQACAKNSDEALYVLAVAEMRMTLGQLDEARQLLEDKCAFFEQSAAMRMALAHIAILQNDPAAAARYYHDATLLLPEDKNLRWTYARAAFDAGKYAEAARILEELRRDPPAMPKAMSKNDTSDPAAEQQAAASIKVSILMSLGESYLGLKRPMDARDCFQEIIRTQPGNVSAYLALGQTGLMTNDLNTTLAAAQKASRFAPDNVQAIILQATVLQKQSKWTESLEMLNKAVKLEPRNGTVLCLQGLTRMELGQKNAAADSFEKALAANPQDAWAGELLEKVRPTVLLPAANTAPPAPAEDEVIISTPVETNRPAVLDILPAQLDLPNAP
jgi:tetratricopeptide (TPR) repeat protein